jgi:hypothetical protein
MKREYVLAAIVGMFLLAYLLDAVVDPLRIHLATPYQYLNAEYFSTYPFTTASIFIRAAAIFLTPLLILSLFSKAYAPKGFTILLLAVLIQLYALQQIATSAQVIPTEWAISLAIAGAALFVPAVYYLGFAGVASAHQKMVNSVKPYAGRPPGSPDHSPDWLKEKKQ